MNNPDVSPISPLIFTRVKKSDSWHIFSTTVAFDAFLFQNKQNIGYLKHSLVAAMTGLRHYQTCHRVAMINLRNEIVSPLKNGQ